MAPLVSVVVPVFDGLPYLREAIASVLSQTHTDLELVIADGGSRDASRQVIEEIAAQDTRVRVVDGAPGAAANWTAVTRAARGEFVKLLCQDDLLAPDALSAQTGDLLAHPDAVMAIAQRDIIEASGAAVARARGCQGLRAGVHPGSEILDRCYRTGANVIGEPLAVLFRREALLASMPWDDRDPLMLDVRQYAKVAPWGAIVVRREPIGSFRVSAASWSTRLASVQREQFARWQQEYAASMSEAPTRMLRLRARIGMEQQVLLRRSAYAVLRARGLLAPRP